MSRKAEITLETLLGMIIVVIVLVGLIMAGYTLLKTNAYDEKVFENVVKTVGLVEEGRVLGLLPFKSSDSALMVFNKGGLRESGFATMLNEDCSDKTCICLYRGGDSFEKCEPFGSKVFRSAHSKTANTFIITSNRIIKEEVVGVKIHAGATLGSADSLRENSIFEPQLVGNTHSLGKTGKEYIFCTTPSDCRE
jgi:hypothetical protein